MFDLKVALSALPVLFYCVCVSGQTPVQDSRQHQLATLYHYAGIHTHLSQVHDTVMQETALSLKGCADDATLPAIDNLVVSSTNAQTLKADYIQTLGEQLSGAQIDRIIQWTRSPTGLKVHQAEADSALLDEVTFEALISDYRSSGKHTKIRAKSIETMLANTGAVYFVSALNTETSTIVAMASLCQLDEESLEAAQATVRSTRGEEGLIRAFLRSDFLMPASVIYRQLSSYELDEFIAFTNSDSGKAYYRALIQSIRIVLSSRVDSLEQQLDAMLAAESQ